MVKKKDEQQVLDQADLVLRVERVKCRRAAKDAADAEVVRLRALLRAAVRRAKEAEWDLSFAERSLLGPEKA